MLLKQLIEASAVSGQENEVREIIKKELEGKVDNIYSDKIGNLIVFKKGKKDGNKILISAAMDEIGGIVTKINPDGTVKFTKAGDYDDRLLVSKIVKVGSEGVTGVIGAKPIHLQKADERRRALNIDQLYIDIGANSKEDASKYVSIGDYVSIWSETKDFTDDIIKGKALDSRIPCSVLIELLKDDLEYSIYASFTVMDKVRIFGSRTVGYAIKPDYTIVLDGAEAELGKGVALNIKELRAIFDKDLIDKIMNISKEKDIKLQLVTEEKKITGADLYQLAAEGIKVAKLSVPCKYLNTSTNLARYEDINSLKQMLNEIIIELGGKVNGTV